MRDLWVDFNDLDGRGHLTTTLRFATPGVVIVPGQKVLVGDDEGTRCEALVESIDGCIVDLSLNFDTFESTEAS